MEKRAFVGKEEIILSSRFQKIFDVLSITLRLILGVFLFPFVYSATRVFLSKIFMLDNSLKIGFFSGMAFFLIIYLFVWEPTIIYKKGQRFVQVIFGFFSPLVKVAPYLLPIYTIILFLSYFLLSLIFRIEHVLDVFMFLFGVSIALHFVFSAKFLKSKSSDYLKANYIFSFSLIWLLNIFILSFGFNLILNNFSFVDFFNQTIDLGCNIFNAIFKQLFL
ncbi:MAG: hypothetical protein NC826_05875 [Candidatus Omnitrophica bacterium]|nr:hypothetical protein [Candidatus Omnitrophota bacterium]